jgi:hypothetical protein
MPGKQIFNAFFSYSHLDAKATPRHVEPLAVELENIVSARLVNAGLAVWRDTTHLLTGRRWNAEVENRLRGSDILIVLFSPSWIGSDYCRKEYLVFEEVEAGHGDGEFVVPILLRPIDDQAGGRRHGSPARAGRGCRPYRPDFAAPPQFGDRRRSQHRERRAACDIAGHPWPTRRRRRAA